jgi:hypothetical protein
MGVWANSAKDVWVVGHSSSPTTAPIIARNTGTAQGWTVPNGLPAGSYDLRDVWGYSEFVYAVGMAGAMLQFNGKTGVWTKMSVAGNLYDMDGTLKGEAYVVGDNAKTPASGAAYRVVNGTRTAETLPSGTLRLRGVWVNGFGDVFAVGDAGWILRKQSGGTWTKWYQVPDKLPLNSVWGYGTTLFVAAEGTSPTAGKVWTFRITPQCCTGVSSASLESTSFDNSIMKVWGATDTDVYAVSAAGRVWRGSQGSWESKPRYTGGGLYGVGGVAGGNAASHVYAVGVPNLIVHGQ